MLRPYRVDDAAAVIAVWDAATRLAHPFLDEAFLAAERENLRNLYLPNTETTVWEEDSTVIGFIALLEIEGGSEIGGLFVAPPSARRGIGRALLQHARGAKGQLEVEVFEANPIGRAFYAKQGFRPIGQSTHEPTGQQVLRLRLA